MADPEPAPIAPPAADETHPARRRAVDALTLAAILAVAAGLRSWDPGAASLWYDEVVTMRVARAEGPADLIRRLDQLDGTRAPLHPLVLHAWLGVFGHSDLAGRAFSALCGVATVAVVYLVGRGAYDHHTGLWSSWLAAICPPLVYYSREARMYAWLVFLTALSWLVLLSFRHAASPGRCLAYAALLAALAYSHPLGLFMIAAHGLAYLAARPGLALGVPRWLMTQAGVALAVAPWLPRYLNHGTDYSMPRYAIRYLLAVPIEYIGGNSLVLPFCAAIIGAGLVTPLREPDGRRRRRLRFDRPVEAAILVAWAAVPPSLLYAYSYIRQPIFGPSRYHLFCAPAYLILVAHGLTRLPPLLRWPLAAAGLALSMSLLHGYRPALKADWRGLGGWLDRRHPRASEDRVTIVVHPGDPRFPREPLEAARYYLEPRFRVIADAPATDHGPVTGGVTYHVECLMQPDPGRPPEPGALTFHGLILNTTPGHR